MESGAFSVSLAVKDLERELQKALKAQGMTFETEADENSTGPAHFVIVDPDGNPILIDQHV